MTDAPNDPDLVARLVKMMSRGPSTDLVSNLSLRLETGTFGGTCFPVSISDPPNCYICAPSKAYLDYAIEETRHFTANPVLRHLLTGLIRCCRPLLKAAGLDRQVQVNNWLFSTNPVPPIDTAMAREIRDGLTAAHRTRAIVIRSLNTLRDQSSLDALAKAGFALLPARQIYLYDPLTAGDASTDMKQDRELLAQTPYSVVSGTTFSADDFTRAAMLYHMLYIDKYTHLNPQYTPAFLARAHQIGLLEITGLRGPDDRLDGVVGLFRNGQTQTVPIIGYDTGRPRDTGLYRMLGAIAQQRADDTGVLYNRSAGAATYKRHRNAVPAIEYTAVYVGHLGIRARAATAIITSVLTRVGIPLLRRFAL